MASLPPKASLGYQVRIAHRAFDRLLAARLAPFGLKAGYWYYLRVLWLREGLTQKELGDAINVKENTTVAMILGMEKDGLLTRKRDEIDRRKMCVYLTPKGRDLEKKLMHLAPEINEAATKGISKRELEKCLMVLHHVSENLQTIDF